MQTRDIDKIVALLNVLVVIDRRAMESLVKHRVVCNMDMVKHATVQVQVFRGKKPVVGMLGILNGICGVNGNGWGPIRAEFVDLGSGKCGHLLRFVRDPSWKKAP